MDEPMKSRARRLVRRASERWRLPRPRGNLAEQVAGLEQRVRDLEVEVEECRRHHHRTAELTDVVQALLVPLARRDDEEIERILVDYADRL